MRSEQSWQRQQAIQNARELIRGSDRFVDFGIRLHTVVQDEAGVELSPGRPKVRIIESRDFGGILDTRLLRFVGPSPTPVVWYGSQEQVELVIHDPTEMKPKILCKGAEGAGKTRGVLSKWLILRALEFTGLAVEGGVTAPTGLRLQTVEDALRSDMDPTWYTWHDHEGVFRLANGVRLRLISTTRRSEEGGSPIQGWDWAFSGSDEIQDSLRVNDDIETRGRRAPNGVYRRMCTATIKDWSGFRDFHGVWSKSPLCEVRRLEGRANPAVHPSHWKNLETSLDPRAYRMKVLALDVGPERAVYHTFHRDRNLRPIPQIGAREITSFVLKTSGFGDNMGVLVGHDPGHFRDVSILLKAFQIGNHPLPHWWAIGEVVTEQSTSEVHGIKLREACQKKGAWPTVLPYQQALIVADPQSEFEARDQPHPTVYRALKKLGFEVRSASPKQHRVPVEARIEMLVSLLCNAAGESRLFVACDESGRPACPLLLEALENSERDLAGNPETKIKNQKAKKKDYSDFTSATAYALWRIERERMAARPGVNKYAPTR